MRIKAVMLAAALIGVAVPGIAAAQDGGAYRDGYPAYGRQGDDRDGYAYRDRHDERRWARERRHEARERRRAWRRAHHHRHHPYGYAGDRY